MMFYIKTLLIINSIFLSMAGCATTNNWDNTKRIENSPQYKDGKFTNPKEHHFEFSVTEMYEGLKAIYFTEQPNSIPTSPLPIKPIIYKDFYKESKDAFHYARLGHSSVMFQLAGKVWLTDPVFTEFITPYEWMGWKRFHPMPIDIDDLGDVEGVIISHDHYDHLDKDVIIKLKDKVNHFIVPLGVGKRLAEWGVPAHKITALDWWESTKVGEVEFISTPAQHFSGRTPFDRAETLWSSWVIRTAEKSLYFSGDSGYFDGFKKIGEKYGPFDITFMECGQYSERWTYIHMMPEQTMRAHKDLKGKLLVPIHNGTFKISFHPWYDPMERITKLGAAENVEVLIPMMGEVINILAPPKQIDEWWGR